MSIVTVTDLVKSYDGGKTEALKGISFTVQPGEIFGLIGPDGAGKTTIFRILTTLLLPDSGSATVDGLDIRKDFRRIRRHIGYMPGKFSLYPDLTVEENLDFFATVFGTTADSNRHLVKEIYEQIEPFSNRKAGNLSGGMKQKLALSCALIHAPKVLFLDEPTTGVDPVSRREFWEMLGKLRKRYNISIIVSTPYMDEAMQCDRIGLIQNGRFMIIDTPRGIIDGYSETLLEVSSDKMHRLLDDLRSIEGVKTAFAFGDVHHVTIDSGLITPEHLRRRLAEAGHGDIRVELASPTIEDCFMNLQN